MSKLYTKSVGLKKETFERLKIYQATNRGSIDTVINDLLDCKETYDMRWKDVSEDTYIRLMRRKETPKEPMDMVINRILDGDTRQRKR